MRSAEHRFRQRRRLEQVVSTVGHQAATDERAVGQRVEKQQFAHGIAEQHRRLGGDRLPTGAPHRDQAFAFAQLVY
ncbi:hypothetical protein D3C76_1730910 [compost metagenome]